MPDLRPLYVFGAEQLAIRQSVEMNYLLAIAIAAVFFFAKWLNALEREAVLRRDYDLTCEDNARLTAQLEVAVEMMAVATVAVRDAERRYDRRCVGMAVGDN